MARAIWEAGVNRKMSSINSPPLYSKVRLLYDDGQEPEWQELDLSGLDLRPPAKSDETYCSSCGREIETGENVSIMRPRTLIYLRVKSTAGPKRGKLPNEGAASRKDFSERTTYASANLHRQCVRPRLKPHRNVNS